MMAPQWLLGFSLILFGLAWVTILLRRNLLVMSMGIQWMFVAVALAFVGFARVHGASTGGEELVSARGEAAAIVVLSLAVVHLIVGLAVILSQTRSRDSSDVDDASDLRW